jgi:hypothetical protein
MTEHPTEGSEIEWPVRWADAADAPPLAQAFLEQIAPFEAAPSHLTPRHVASESASRRPLAIGAATLALAALASLYFWIDRDAPRDEIALAPAHDPLPIETARTLEPEALEPEEGLEPAALAPPTLPDPVVGAPMAPEDEAEPAVTPATRVALVLLIVETTPAVDVQIDGVMRGRTPLRARVTPGPHRMRMIRTEVGIDTTETIDVPVGGRLRLMRTLDTAFDPDGPTPPHRVNQPPTTPPLARSGPSAADLRYATARECAISGDHACVIETLRGHCTTAREFELLISSMRSASGYEREIETHMRTYLSRFPRARLSGVYRAYLVAHSGR